MLVLIDNYDSFTYNLVQYLSELGVEVQVYRNDAIDIEAVQALEPEFIVISPGPRTPDKAGISMAVIAAFQDTIPILGVCLGHQAIGQVFGGKVIPAHTVMHGKTSMIYHNGSWLFRELPNPFEATRYHSLIVQDPLPECLEATAWTKLPSGECDEIMGLRHKTLPIAGVQFHPESILTKVGQHLLGNFLGKKAKELSGFSQ